MPSSLNRNPKLAAKHHFDLIIIGGGIHGAMLALEATHMGRKPLLLEQKDFGGATSFNSLRLIHGGFRYLQSLDYFRLKNSAAERHWFLRYFPHLVRSLPCLVPIYGIGLRRKSTLRIAVSVYDLLTKNRNLGMQQDRYIPSGQLVSTEEVIRIFPMIDPKGLQGGAIWYDGFVENSQRLIIEVLKMARHNGATVLNYTQANQLIKDGNQVTGVNACDLETKTSYLFSSNIVINASGPWCRELAKRFDKDEASLFRSMLSWNLLFDREPVSDHGIAVTPKGENPHTYFLVPWNNKLLAGTGQAPWAEKSRKPAPSMEQIMGFIEDINQAIPGINLNSTEILYIFSGLQSATNIGGKDFSTKDIVLDHSRNGGPEGLFSVSGIKLTTSRLTAEKTLRQVYSNNTLENDKKEKSYNVPRNISSDSWNFPCTWRPHGNDWEYKLHKLIDEESVIHLDDLIFRRTTLWEDPQRAIDMAPLICKLFDWSKERSIREVERITSLVNSKRTN